MKRFVSIIAALALVVSLAACQTVNKQGIGTVAGAGLGGLAGSQIGGGKGQLIAVGAGVLIGALVGNSIGASLDKADQAAVIRTTQNTLETTPDGRAGTWNNPNSGNHGTVTPTNTYQTASGYCREFTHTIFIGGKAEKAYGTACRQPDGTWEIQ